MEQSYLKNNYRLLLSAALFLIVFILTGLLWTGWWFNGSDDFNAMLSVYKIKNWKDLINAIIRGNTGFLTNPTNFIAQPCQPSFLCVYFRPLHVLFFTIQYWLFGTNAYLYLLTNAFFHAINTILLFNIFLWITNYIPATILALLFAFHPQIAFRFGAVVNIQYYVNLTLILCSIILFKKFIDSNKWLYNIFSALFLMTSLFIRETMIVMPAIIFMSTYLYKNKQYSIKSFFIQFLELLKITLPCIIATCTYLFTRAYLYPLKFAQSTTHLALASAPLPTSSLLSALKHRIPELKVIIYDLFCLSWLPWGCKTVRAIILLLIFLSLLLLFIKTKNKLTALSCFMFTIILLWPSFIICNSPRYLYEAYPFFLTGILLLFTGYTFKYSWFRHVIKLVGCIFSTFLIFFSVENFTARIKKMKIFSSALNQLVANPQIHNRSLCFLAYPSDGLGDHFASILWVMLNNQNIPIYFDSKTMITQHDSNLFKNKKWRLCASNYFDKNYLKITILDNGFRLTSINPQKVAFYPQEPIFSIGQTITHETATVNGESLITDLTLIIDEAILQQKPLFIWWDYEKQNFVIYDFKL